MITFTKSATFRHALILGIVGGALITVLKLTEFRFLVMENSFQIYAAIVAALFAAFGIWLGLRIAIPKHTVEVREVAVPAEPFSVNIEQVDARGITPRELELLAHLAAGMSNREIAEHLVVSENTVKRI